MKLISKELRKAGNGDGSCKCQRCGGTGYVVDSGRSVMRAMGVWRTTLTCGACGGSGTVPNGKREEVAS